MSELFKIDPRLLASSIAVAEGKLSTILLKNNRHFPWLILVPRVSNCSEIIDLNQQQQIVLMQEISRVSSQMKVFFQPDKLNIGALGNIVNQLHIHIIARFKHDEAWPHSLWQAGIVDEPYGSEELGELVNRLRSLFN
ncbi:HIT domain-containing protein [Legionella dresdenensis]|uniref:HIT domain-containing protein n=1 Tax=Legionella dresdenensis TaxID=450200 RepID=A0ABV8CHJ9_9GAMM